MQNLGTPCEKMRFCPAFCAAKKQVKSRQGRRKSTRSVLSRQGHRRKAEKGFNWVCAKFWFCELVQGLQNLGASLKGFNCCGAKLRLRWADSRFAKPRSFPERERVYSFRVYEKNQKYTRGLRTSGLRGRFKSPVDKVFLLKQPAFIR